MSEICVEAFNLVAQIGVLSLKTERDQTMIQLYTREISIFASDKGASSEIRAMLRKDW